MRLQESYTVGARSLASRSVTGLARTKVTPNALTTAGVSLCVAEAVLVPFEDRDKLLFYWLAAAVFVGWRFGWIWFTPALLVSVVADWIVASRVRPVTICYRCDAEYRDVPPNPRHRGYDPHVAERDAERKTVRRMR